MIDTTLVYVIMVSSLIFLGVLSSMFLFLTERGSYRPSRINDGSSSCNFIDMDTIDLPRIEYTILETKRMIDEETFQPLLELTIRLHDNNRQYVIEYLVELSHDIRANWCMSDDDFISRVLSTIQEIENYERTSH